MRLTKLDDSKLVRMFIDGNQEAIEKLIERHKSKVYTYIIITVKSKPLAEDIFQDTFLKVINSLRSGRYQERGMFSSWIMRIAHNLVIDHFRRERNMRTYSNDNYDYDIFNSKRFSDPNIEDDIIWDQITGDVRKLVNELPPTQREVIMLRHFGEMSFKDIAAQTNVSINTALGRMRYALINLRKLIEKKNISLTEQ